MFANRSLILRPLLTAAVLAIAGAPLCAQQLLGTRAGIDFAALDAPAARASREFEAFVQQNGGTWWTRWCPATGTPMEIFGTGLPIADWRGSWLDEARRQATAALAAHRQLLGLGDCEFREVIGTSFGNVWSFTFEQFHQGVPVIGGRADVRINTCGRIASLGSQAFVVPANLSIVPGLDALNAERIAWLALDQRPDQPLPGAPRATRLCLWGDLDSDQVAPLFLCWEVPVDALDKDGGGPIGRYYVDANSGVVHHYTNDKHNCGLPGCATHGAHRHGDEPPVVPPATYTVMGFARDGSSSLTPATNVPLPGLEINVPGVGVVVTDQFGQFAANLTAPATVTVTMNGIHHQLILGANAVTQGATLQPGIPATIQLLSGSATANQLAHTTCSLWVHRVNEWARGILGNSPQMAQADGVLPTVNLGQTCNAFYSGNTINFYAAGGGCSNTTSASVVAHEWGHGLDERYGGISQIQGLSEAWGDIVSEYLLDDPIIGAGFFTGGGGLRTGLNTTQYPPPSEVHAAGEVFMGFAWLFRENLRTAFGTQQAISLSNAIVVGSIAANALDQPSAVNQVFLADDNDGNLANGVPHYSQLESACLAHSLPYPIRQIGAIAAAPLADTTRQLTARPVLAMVTPNLGSFTQVRLHYNDGAAHQIAMIGTTNQDEYTAMLPGVPATTTVTWHIEALHSGGATLRRPPAGEFSYQVYDTRPFYLEDFEGGAVGWTHGASSGVDDWEIGAPTGASGPGWRDPSVAASGTTCAGTDLTQDGAYSASSQSWLRSPPINCAGLGGIRLRFKRWLTVDAVVHDLAWVNVNGTMVWINVSPPSTPTVAPTVDSGWLQQEVRVPIADNNPAVVLEWLLQSDATVAYGGWNIDDVELLTTSQPPQLANTLQVLPAMATQGAPMTVMLHTQQASSPFLVIAGDAPGPTLIPGIALLELGGNIGSLGGTTDASGNFATGFTAPTGVALTGLIWYSQALTLDPTSQIVSTNPCVNLFTQ